MVSFLTSPILAYINLRVMNGPNVPAAQRRGLILSCLSWLGLVFFLVMAAGYVYAEFFANTL
ncbi:hypothetical protein [Geoalkalibacter sp.]|uniref:hypothetical protein n=1 Tax=Geoalkalibacter sp. TaxID=3041440 RepID=UPI00272EADF7|nr:hypothetical protein [Geoalkalibacter sp.]